VLSLIFIYASTLKIEEEKAVPVWFLVIMLFLYGCIKIKRYKLYELD
jgi:hypothetical protein